MSKKKVVVALGHTAFGSTFPEQKIAVKSAALAITDLVEADADVVITHSNAPQVGMIHTAMNEFGKVHDNYTYAPMSVCSAMSQGYIGYDLQNAIREAMLDRGISKTVCTILTQVIVDPYDDAFYKPIKVIGRYLTKEEAKLEEEKGNYVTKEEGGYRRIVCAPKPKDIVEIDAIRTLSDSGCVVIACGGGGIPVLSQGHHLKGASAVIEKDFASAKLAEMLDADTLIILTKYEKLFLNYGTQLQQEIGNITTKQARNYAASGQFPYSSTLPKIMAGVHFVEQKPGRTAVITSLDAALSGFEGNTGTIITA